MGLWLQCLVSGLAISISVYLLPGARVTVVPGALVAALNYGLGTISK